MYLAQRLASRAKTRTLDKKRRRNPVPTRKAENSFAFQLRKVARHIGEIINGFPAGDPQYLPSIDDMLRRYSDALTAWATFTSQKMLLDVDRRDKQTYFENAKEISKALADEIRNAPTGEVMRGLLAEQVDLIKSLPIDAAKRVHELTLKGLEDSTRASEIAKEIQRSGEVSESRATLIARTEVARTAAHLTQARAQYIGSTHYIWRTLGDSDVRPGHKVMNNKIFAWNDPPMVNEGTDKAPNWIAHHPGEIWNCRCYAEPIIPDL
ncbi:phage minor head protein [Achromobacter ruhlandii]|uniref:phage head morphogenesis protein n=1 Tax=Achromobacter ruhlandii TaxID=72557 RepID=UPI000C259042|nr:phage minor head protein [Achromobacter ruhlandii]PJM69178.1 phage head morphogenesis protein [Achromobacter ruhlandii]